jgi:hypothetical protein
VLKSVTEALGDRFEGGVPLMDGGIWDNQGVDSLLLAFERGAATLLVSDVAARNDDIYTFPPPHHRGWLTLRMASILAWVLLGASLVSAALLARAGWGEWREEGGGWGFVFRFGIPFAYCAGISAVLIWLRFVIRDVQARIRRQVQVTDAWHDLEYLTVQEALTLVELRVGSLLALTSTLFMKRIRSLVFSGVTQDPAYKGRWMANYIYAMALNRPALYKAQPWLQPSPAMVELANTAEAVPTALWFDSAAQMEMVVRAGEATTCFILLKHLVETRADALKDPASPASELFARLRKEWAVFNAA